MMCIIMVTDFAESFDASLFNSAISINVKQNPFVLQMVETPCKS